MFPCHRTNFCNYVILVNNYIEIEIYSQLWINVLIELRKIAHWQSEYPYTLVLSNAVEYILKFVIIFRNKYGNALNFNIDSKRFEYLIWRTMFSRFSLWDNPNTPVMKSIGISLRCQLKSVVWTKCAAHFVYTAERNDVIITRKSPIHKRDSRHKIFYKYYNFHWYFMFIFYYKKILSGDFFAEYIHRSNIIEI